MVQFILINRFYFSSPDQFKKNLKIFCFYLLHQIQTKMAIFPYYHNNYQFNSKY